MKLCLGVRFISETLSNLIRINNTSVLVSSKSNKGSTLAPQCPRRTPQLHPRVSPASYALALRARMVSHCQQACYVPTPCMVIPCQALAPLPYTQTPSAPCRHTQELVVSPSSTSCSQLGQHARPCLQACSCTQTHLPASAHVSCMGFIFFQTRA